MKKKNVRLDLNTILLVPFLYYLILIFIKYYSNGISFELGNLLQIGNQLDAIPLYIFIAAILLSRFNKTKMNQASVILINSLNYISIAVLFIAFFSTFFTFDFFLPMVNYPFKKVFSGLIFSASYFIQLYSAVYLLLSAFNESVKPVRAFYFSFSVSATILLLSLLTVLNTSNGNHTFPEENSDIGVILGAAVWSKDRPSTLFKGRIKKGYELYKAGKIYKLQVTGGNAPGELSEAEVAKNYLLKLGVPEDRIMIENLTETTAEQIKFIRNLKNKSDSGVVVISDGFHLRRIMEMSKFFGVNVNGISSNYQLNWRSSIYHYLREAFALSLFWLFAI